MDDILPPGEGFELSVEFRSSNGVRIFLPGEIDNLLQTNKKNPINHHHRVVYIYVLHQFITGPVGGAWLGLITGGSPEHKASGRKPSRDTIANWFAIDVMARPERQCILFKHPNVEFILETCTGPVVEVFRGMICQQIALLM